MLVRGSGGAIAISCPWASAGEADTMIQRITEFPS